MKLTSELPIEKQITKQFLMKNLSSDLFDLVFNIRPFFDEYLISIYINKFGNINTVRVSNINEIKDILSRIKTVSK